MASQDRAEYLPADGPGDRWEIRRILVVARWYPSHDSPSRGSFVADQVAAYRSLGIEVVVASWEPAGIRPVDGFRSEVGVRASAAWARAVSAPEASNRTSSWGATGVPVARLPVVSPSGPQPPLDTIAAHAAALVPFGTALAQRWPFDLVHAHVGLPDGAAAAQLATALRLPLIVTEHSSTSVGGLEEPEARPAYARLLESGRAVVAVSADLARALEMRLECARGTIAVIPNLVPLDLFPFAGAADRDLDELLWVGARRESKGMETLLLSVARAREVQPALHLRMIGDPPDAATEDRWRTLAHEVGLDGAVAFEPATDRAGVSAAMRRAGIFVHPSPRETFGMVAAEALASGLPIATRRSGGVEEIVAGVGAGVSVADPDDADGLAVAILRQRVGLDSLDRAQLRAAMVARYAPDRIAQALLDLGRSAARTVAIGRPEQLGGERTTTGRDIQPAATTLPLAVVVVGLRRAWIARRIATLPSSLANRVVAITEVGTTGRPIPLPGGPRWLEIDPDVDYARRLDALGGPPVQGRNAVNRLVTSALHPARTRQRRELLDDRPRLRRDAVRAAVRDIVQEIARVAGAPVVLIALDAEDIEASADTIGTSASLAPGALRWLVDAWDAAGRP